MLKYILCLIITCNIFATEFNLSVNHTEPYTRNDGHYKVLANFNVNSNNYGIVIQRIDVLYEVGNYKKSESFYEVFLMRPNGYSYEVDWFQDGEFEEEGVINVWAAAVYVDTPTIKEMEDFDSLNVLNELNAHGFTRFNPDTQAGGLPSTINFIETCWHPLMTKSNSNVVYRRLQAIWKVGEKTKVSLNNMKIDMKTYETFWNSHILPKFSNK